MSFKIGDKVYLLKCTTNDAWWLEQNDFNIKKFIECSNNKEIAIITEVKKDDTKTLYYTNKTKNLAIYENELKLANSVRNFESLTGGNI